MAAAGKMRLVSRQETPGKATARHQVSSARNRPRRTSGACQTMPIRRLFHRFNSDERGVALALVTSGMVATLGIVRLTLDGGRYNETRRQLQNTVDQAAHASAQELPDTVAAETKARQYRASTSRAWPMPAPLP